jgi:excisionase family DNA binding protein
MGRLRAWRVRQGNLIARHLHARARSTPMSALAPAVDPLLTTDQAAEILNVAPTTLHTWRCTKAVKVPHIRIGRKVRYRRSALMAFLEKNSTEG